MNSTAFGPIVSPNLPHLRRALTATSRPLSSAVTARGMKLPRMACGGLAAYHLAAGGSPSWLGARDTQRAHTRGRGPDWGLAGFAEGGAPRPSQRDVRLVDNEIERKRRRWNPMDDPISGPAIRAAVSSVAAFAEGGRPDMGAIAVRDAEQGMFPRVVPDYLLQRFGPGGMVSGIVDAIARNRQLRNAGRTVAELTRGPTGIREGEKYEAGHYWRKLPEGGSSVFGTEADDAYRQKLDDIHRMAVEMRREREGYAGGGDVEEPDIFDQGYFSPSWDRQSFMDTMREIPRNAPGQIGHYMAHDYLPDALTWAMPGIAGARLMKMGLGPVSKIGARIVTQMGAGRKAENAARLAEAIGGKGRMPDRWTLPGAAAGLGIQDATQGALDRVRERTTF